MKTDYLMTADAVCCQANVVPVVQVKPHILLHIMIMDVYTHTYTNTHMCTKHTHIILETCSAPGRLMTAKSMGA